MLQSIDDIFACFQARGDRAYDEDKEAVTQTAHALQAAELAVEARSAPSLVAAALLHDIGHILDDEARRLLFQGTDNNHEDIGAKALAGLFGAEVTEPIRLHVPAKRYLCATRADYFDRLSPASVHSLALQGGPMSETEAAAFDHLPYAKQAVRLRLWDEAAKVPGKPTRSLENFRPQLEEALRASHPLKKATG